jgi:exodeoxyribonuclease V gamma subunit
LRNWLRNPAQELLRQRWRMPLRGLASDTLPAEEPLDSRLDPRQSLWRTLLQSALDQRSPPAQEPDDLLLASGLLPPGHPGRLAYAREHESAAALFEQASAMAPFRGCSERISLNVDLQLPDLRIEGQPGPLYRLDQTLWLVEFVPDRKRFAALSSQLDLMLRAAVVGLSLSEGESLRVQRIAPGKHDEWADGLSVEASSVAAARPSMERFVQSLATLWRQAQANPLGYFPKSTDALLSERDVEAAWLGGPRTLGERDWAPGYAWMLAGERSFWEAEDLAHAGFVDTAQRLQALLSLRWATPGSEAAT